MFCRFSLVSSISSNDQSKGASDIGSSSGLCRPSKYGWEMHCSTVYLLLGLNISILESKSSATGFDLGNSVEKFCLVLFANLFINSRACGLVMKSKSSDDGVPNTDIIF